MRRPLLTLGTLRSPAAISCVADCPVAGPTSGGLRLMPPLLGNSPGARGYQFFGRNYQADVLVSAPPLRHTTGTSRRFDGEKMMESFAVGIGNLIGFQLMVGFIFGIY